MPAKHCQQCGRPFPPRGPCPHCPVVAPVAATPVNPTRTASAIRADENRAKKKSENPGFNNQEAKRRKKQREENKRAVELRKLLNIDADNLGLTKDSKISLGDKALMVGENNRANNFTFHAPVRSQLTDDEIRAKLPQDTDGKIKSLELLDIPTSEMSIDEIDKVFAVEFTDLGWLRKLMYGENPDETPEILNAASGVLTNFGPHIRTGTEVQGGSGPNSYDKDADTSNENRGPRFINVVYRPSKDVQAMRQTIKRFVNFEPEHPGVCLLCQKQDIGKGVDEKLAGRFGIEWDEDGHWLEAVYRHLEKLHPKEFQELQKEIKNAQVEKTRKRCSHDHDAMAARHKGVGIRKVYCRCGKLIYKPPKQKKTKTGRTPDLVDTVNDLSPVGTTA